MAFRVVPWLGGLALISWLGMYPDVGDGAGNLGVFGFGWSIVVVGVFSALIMWLALATCLPRERVEKHLHESWGLGELEDLQEADRH